MAPDFDAKAAAFCCALYDGRSLEQLRDQLAADLRAAFAAGREAERKEKAESVTALIARVRRLEAMGAFENPAALIPDLNSDDDGPGGAC
jgi:hypothetical protein